MACQRVGVSYILPPQCPKNSHFQTLCTSMQHESVCCHGISRSHRDNRTSIPRESVSCRSAVPVYNHMIVMIRAKHAIMRRIQPQQPTLVRIDTQPLRGQDPQDMRVCNQQHIVPLFQQRGHPGDDGTRTRRSLLKCFPITVMDRHLLASGQHSGPITSQLHTHLARPVTPHLPCETTRLTDLLTRMALSPAIIPFSKIVKHRRLRIPGKRSGLPCPAQRTDKHMPCGKSIRECATQTLPGLFRLILPGWRQRDISATGMLSRHAPYGLSVPQQHQLTRRGGGFVACTIDCCHSGIVPPTCLSGDEALKTSRVLSPPTDVFKTSSL